MFTLFPQKRFFNQAQEEMILSAIREAEKNTSGEIKVHIESAVQGDVFERSLEIFAKLAMHDTEHRNGVLFYVAMRSHRFAIVADKGINQVVPEGFWDEIKDLLHENFKKSAFTEGLAKGILMAGDQLKAHFPYQGKGIDKNEISDDISTGD
jgi:uncharacterized membrane protein